MSPSLAHPSPERLRLGRLLVGGSRPAQQPPGLSSSDVARITPTLSALFTPTGGGPVPTW